MSDIKEIKIGKKTISPKSPCFIIAEMSANHGGDFDKVKDNILALLASRKKARAGLPKVEMTYLINAYNEHEVDDCRRFWRKTGLDAFHPKDINLNVHRRTDGATVEDLSHWLPKKRQSTMYTKEEDAIILKQRSKPCTSYLTPIISSNGDILLCCHDIFNSVTIGNILEEPLETIWNKPSYKKIRKLANQHKLPICQRKPATLSMIHRAAGPGLDRLGQMRSIGTRKAPLWYSWFSSERAPADSFGSARCFGTIDHPKPAATSSTASE